RARPAPPNPTRVRRSARGFWGEKRDSFARRGGLLQKTPIDSVGCPSGQREQAVNLPASAYEGSNPSPTTAKFYRGVSAFARGASVRSSTDVVLETKISEPTLAGVTQLVECQPSKLNVAGSNPVSGSAGSRVRSDVTTSRGGLPSALRSVVATNPVSRSAHMRNPALIAQAVERVLGKDEVTSSNLVEGSHG